MVSMVNNEDYFYFFLNLVSVILNKILEMVYLWVVYFFIEYSLNYK